jgi:glycosyltransferase involved in cell wall biosynthesis
MNGMKKKIVIVMPAYNAEKTLESVVKRIPKDFMKKIYEIIVIDDGSKDETYEVAKKLGLKTIRHLKNRGYGGAQKTGFNEALKDGADFVVLLHSDGQYAPELLPRIIQPLLNSECDAVFGSRVLGGNVLKGGMPFHRYIGNRFLTLIENLVFGMKISEFHSGYRAYSRKALENINFNLNSDSFVFDSEILVQIKEKGMKIGEIPISTFYGSEISYLKPLKYGSEVLRVMFRYILHKIGIVRYKQFE